MRKVLHGDRVMAREIGVDRRGRREGAIVEVLERVNQRVVGRVFVRARRAVRCRREQAHQPGYRCCAGRDARRQGRTGGGWWRSSVSRTGTPQPIGARGRGARQLRRSGHGNRDRAAQARLCRSEFSPAAEAASEEAAGKGAAEGPRRARGSARAAARDHRRRDGEGLRRCGVLRDSKARASG